MDASRFSLSYLQPSGSAPAALAREGPLDPWTEAVNFFSDPILRILQNQGSKTVGEIFDLLTSEGVYVKVDINQLYFIVKRMIDDKKISIVSAGPTPETLKVAISLPH